MKKTNKRLLVAGGILCAIGVLFLGVGVASGGKNYVKTADLNRISGNAMMDSSDSHVILSKTKINSFSSVNVDLRKNLTMKTFTLHTILRQIKECCLFPIRYRMIL